MIPIIAASTAPLVLIAMAVMQVLVASGRPYGAFVYGGQHRTLPLGLRVMSAVAVVLYGAIATILFARAGVLPGQETAFVRVTTWALFAFFTVGIAMNAISRSRPERLTATPACVVLSLAVLAIALSA